MCELLTPHLQAIGEKLYSVREDGQICLWSPDVQWPHWQQTTTTRLPPKVANDIRMTTVGSVNVVESYGAAEVDLLMQLRMGAECTKVIGSVPVFVVVCTSPYKTVDEATAEAEAAEEYEYIYSDDEGEDGGGGEGKEVDDLLELGDEEKEEGAEEGGEEGAGGKKAKGGFEELAESPDSVLIWHATTGVPINVTFPEGYIHARGSVTCVAVSAGYVVVGRDCGSLDAYHIKMTVVPQSGLCAKDKVVPGLVPAQHYVGHKGPIDALHTVGGLAKGDGDMYASNVLLYSYHKSRVLVHEMKSGTLAFKFETRPGVEKGNISHLHCFRCFQTPADNQGKAALKDHCVISIGTEVEVWSLEGDVKAIATYQSDDAIAAAAAAGSGEEEEEEDDVIFEIGQGAEPVVEVLSDPDAPTGSCLQRHVYTGHTKDITSMVVEQKYAFTGCGLGAVRVWRCVEPWQCLLVLTATEGPVARVLVPDLNTCWVAYGSGFVRSWDLRAVHADMYAQELAAEAGGSGGGSGGESSGGGGGTAGGKADGEPVAAAAPQLAATFSATTGVSTTVFPIGYNRLPPAQPNRCRTKEMTCRTKEMICRTKEMTCRSVGQG